MISLFLDSISFFRESSALVSEAEAASCWALEVCAAPEVPVFVVSAVVE